MSTHTEAKHTPGPWSVDARSSGHRYNGEPVKYFSVSHTSDRRDCYVALDVAPVTLIRAGGEEFNAEGEANARLIAAAPELLAALETMLKVSLKCDDKAWAMAVERADETRPCDMALDAIAKAKGGA